MKFNQLPLLLLALTTAAALGQNLDLPYSSGSTGADGPFTVPVFPQGTVKSSMAYDPVRQECVLFGGSSFLGGVATYLNATRTWKAEKWALKSPAAAPSARHGAAMAFDPVRNEMLLFGGRNAGGMQGDTWAWNGTNWLQKSPATSPAAREGAAMAWDTARGEAILVGGETAAGPSGETWAWNGSDWELKSPQAGGAPVGSYLAMTYDPSVQQCVVVGDSSTTAAGIWAWNGTVWANRTPASNPTARRGAVFVYNPTDQQCYLIGGLLSASPQSALSDVWTWNGVTGAWSAWTLTSYSLAPPARGYGVGCYDPAASSILLSHGAANATGNGGLTADTWALYEGVWFGKAGPVYTFDLQSKIDAIWNFTTINIPADTTVTFRKNAANNPVLWLASEGVAINGNIHANGSNGGNSSAGGRPGLGGPGGFDGGSNFQPGKGPGGGSGLDTPYGDASHANAAGVGPYGSLFAQPVLGGSGGGGVSGGGGGGGGAVVIASSRDFILNGYIQCRGGSGGIGYQNQITTRYAGTGSGGLVRIVADRIILGSSASIDTYAAFPINPPTGSFGRTRLEAYIRVIPDANSQIIGSKSLSVPVVGSILTQAGGRLSFSKVAGATVANPPRNEAMNPDIVFTASGPVDIEVHALNVPDGTPVTVTINHSIAGVINLPAVTLQNCKATFSATIPAGSGVMQAFATYNVGGPTGNGQ